jgi:uncharacterized protein (DUF2141 family)
MKLILVPVILCTLTNLHAAEVQLKISQFKRTSVKFYVAIFNSAADFPDNAKKAYKTLIVPVQNQQKEQIIKFQLPEGQYAISVFADENNNQKLDTNILGIPKESFGFSQNPRITFGPPTFQESEFLVDSNPTYLDIKLINF